MKNEKNSVGLNYDSILEIADFNPSHITTGDLGTSHEQRPSWSFETTDKDGYLTTNFLYEQKRVKDVEIIYKMNYHGFRSRHFETLSKDSINILTSGCSQSFGEALPDKLRWKSMLENNLDHKKFKVYDLSYKSMSNRLIVKNIFSFIENFGKPDYMFLVLPDFMRNIKYNKELKRFESVTYNTSFLFNTKAKYKTEYTKNAVEEEELMTSLEYIRTLEFFCKEANIKLLWTTWHQPSSSFYEKINLNNFIKTYEFQDFLKDENNLPEDYPKNINNLDFWVVANDGMHLGSMWHTKMFNLFYSEVMKDHSA